MIKIFNIEMKLEVFHKMKLITICTPMYNEEENVEKFYQEITKVILPLENKYDFEFLFVNDGGMDGSLSKVKTLKKKDSRIKYVDLSRNYGKEIAMRWQRVSTMH